MKRETTHAFVFPDPVAMITVADESGGANIITLAWVGMACSEPVHITIAVRKSRHSHALLMAARQFVVNIPSADLVRQTDHCGTVTGRDHDKFAETGLTPEPAKHVSAPIIAECPYALECEVVEVLELGAHDLFVARVLTAHADERLMDEKGRVDMAAMDPMAYVPHHYHRIVPERIYGYGQSAREAKSHDGS